MSSVLDCLGEVQERQTERLGEIQGRQTEKQNAEEFPLLPTPQPLRGLLSPSPPCKLLVSISRQGQVFSVFLECTTAN